MTLIELICFLAALCGLISGSIGGYRSWGWLGGVTGAVLGMGVGILIAAAGIALIFAWACLVEWTRRMTMHLCPTRLLLRKLPRFGRDTTAIIDELTRRGERLHNELPKIRNALFSEDLYRRMGAWQVMKDWFPDAAAEMREYDPLRVEAVFNPPKPATDPPKPPSPARSMMAWLIFPALLGAAAFAIWMAIHEILLPDVVAVVILAGGAAIYDRGQRRRRRRVAERLSRGLCVACGYNLEGNTSSACPECGAAHNDYMVKGSRR